MVIVISNIYRNIWRLSCVNGYRAGLQQAVTADCNRVHSPHEVVLIPRGCVVLIKQGTGGQNE